MTACKIVAIVCGIIFITQERVKQVIIPVYWLQCQYMRCALLCPEPQLIVVPSMHASSLWGSRLHLNSCPKQITWLWEHLPVYEHPKSCCSIIIHLIDKCVIKLSLVLEGFAGVLFSRVSNIGVVRFTQNNYVQFELSVVLIQLPMETFSIAF